MTIKNQNDTWLSLLILKSTPISGIDRSPVELLCNKRFRTNIQLIKHASSLADQARLRNENSIKYQTGSKALVPLNLGSHILYDKNLDNTNKRPEWSKGVVTDIDGPGRKYNKVTLVKVLPEPGKLLGLMVHLSPILVGSQDPQRG